MIFFETENNLLALHKYGLFNKEKDFPKTTENSDILPWFPKKERFSPFFSDFSEKKEIKRNLRKAFRKNSEYMEILWKETGKNGV